eukprot:CAMPEP_0170178462 /NCGR_PEP_ID=MMETSP0040_2-20121228/11900_1 /TAXON_ID=641309 /ORGANISM="Lotharella oceanica, Strain CCMP622" /LENGTH=99 /DNA_ID=CAMNT_0010421523 /DNA_START=321 /DNA_END=620 /DNA_ORIENTATION=+
MAISRHVSTGASNRASPHAITKSACYLGINSRRTTEENDVKNLKVAIYVLTSGLLFMLSLPMLKCCWHKHAEEDITVAMIDPNAEEDGLFVGDGGGSYY